MDPTILPPDQIDEAAAQLQRFAELGRLSASLLHEISNPLTTALLELGRSDAAGNGVRQAKRSLQILRRYVEAARQQARNGGAVTSFTVRSQFKQSARLLTPLAKANGVRLSIGPVPDCRLHGHPVKFQHVITNLITNAIDAYDTVDDDSDRRVETRLTRRGGSLYITVADRGIGIKPDQLPLIFEPFYTTKTYGRHGLGIGLSMAHRYVTRDFGGSIRVTSSRRYGTRFTLRLPVSRQKTPPANM